MEFSHGWSLLCTAAFFLHVRAPWRTVTEASARVAFQHFSFLHFSLSSKFWDTSTLRFTQDFDLEIHFIMHLFKFLHTKPRPVTLCLFSFAAFYTVDWPKDGCVKSWVANIQFDSTTCAWGEMFDSHFLCTRTSTNHSFAFCLSHVRVLKSSECPEISAFRVWAAGLQSLLGFWRLK